MSTRSAETTRIFILGGDGFCAWPTSLNFSNLGHDVSNIDNELEAGSFSPIQPMGTRLKTWKQASGHDIHYECLDVAKNYHQLPTLMQDEKPDAIVHFAGQRAAPCSMESSADKHYTLRCIRLALENPPKQGERVKILHQMTKTHRIRDLAKIVADIAYVDNPRNEDSDDDLHVKNELAPDPTTLQRSLLHEGADIARKYGRRADPAEIPATATWTRRHKPGVPKVEAGWGSEA